MVFEDNKLLLDKVISELIIVNSLAHKYKQTQPKFCQFAGGFVTGENLGCINIQIEYFVDCGR